MTDKKEQTEDTANEATGLSEGLETPTPKRKPLRRAVLKGVRATKIDCGSDGLRMKNEDCDWISLGGLTSKINPSSELYAFMQDLKLSETLEITIKKVKGL